MTQSFFSSGIATASRWRKPAIALALGGALLGGARAEPVLATADQQALDAKTISIDQRNAFLLLRGQASLAYVTAYGLALTPEASSRLGNALDELEVSAIQKAVNNDPQYPKVYWLNAPPREWFGLKVEGGRYSFDNPDNIYRTIPIDGGSSYVIQGRRFGAGPTDVTFSLIKNPNSQQTIALLTGDQLVVNPDGSYTVTIDNQPANGRVNHIQSTGEAVQLFVRNNLGDWSTETPDALSVTRLGTPTRGPRSDADIVADTRTNLSEAALYYGVGTLGVKTYINPLNTLAQPSSSDTLGTLVTQASSFGHFRLADDEALIATVNTGGAKYFVFPVTDPWSVTVDPIRHQSSLNNKQAVPNADGSYTFVLSVADPGVANWIDPVGLHEGTIMARWQNLPATTPASGGPAIATRVVKLRDLAAYLPPGTQYVTAAQRAQQLQARAAGYARRLATQ
ncbi:hypothetical protein GCM10007860_31670 [Chitiniphilus shinanonensis]|uniref:DUF1214 domain-containing protein n=1 Tax=Chitiniphilus shinanonensis TaxID=553088 RepID=A0ABQ6C1E0_9NEIS|nr:hypothetical protein [Chitiniphilus shinanonensis]GLS06003.1 hypothetical protein GCM10007860_31670 [Chitiniphilus shinanonensis]